LAPERRNEQVIANVAALGEKSIDTPGGQFFDEAERAKAPQFSFEETGGPVAQERERLPARKFAEVHALMLTNESVHERTQRRPIGIARLTAGESRGDDCATEDAAR
jgi:hypothetical protein